MLDLHVRRPGPRDGRVSIIFDLGMITMSDLKVHPVDLAEQLRDHRGLDVREKRRCRRCERSGSPSRRKTRSQVLPALSARPVGRSAGCGVPFPDNLFSSSGPLMLVHFASWASSPADLGHFLASELYSSGDQRLTTARWAIEQHPPRRAQQYSRYNSLCRNGSSHGVADLLDLAAQTAVSA